MTNTDGTDDTTANDGTDEHDSTTDTEPELVARHDHRVGEGPVWHPDEKRLYWLDIPTGRLFRYDPAADEDELALSLDVELGGYTIQEDGSLLLFLSEGAVATWNPNGSNDDGSGVGGGEPATDDALEYVIDDIPAERNSRFNDVIADPEGRVFAGTMPTDDDLGSLYRIDPDGSYERVDDRGYDIPNGMGFTPDLESLHVTESEARTIYLFDYDRETGELSNRRSFTEVTGDEREGNPDGMTVDEEGCVWSARWGGGCVVRYDPDGVEIDRVDIPAPKASSVTFGGPENRDLYVTTAKGHDAEDDPPAGSVFRCQTAVAGVPEFRSRVGLE